MGEKRAEFRIPLMARVDVLWGDADGTPRVAPGTLEDTSHGGMSVRVKNAIRVGSHVTIKWGSEQVSGTVTNCRREKFEYVLGMKREPDPDNAAN
jgi:PilZ domain-containing protein